MTKKERFCRIIESFVNEDRKELLVSLFGDNSKIKIQNIDYSTTKKLIFIEAKLILGEDVCNILDESITISDYVIGSFIKESMDYILPDTEIALTLTYDI